MMKLFFSPKADPYQCIPLEHPLILRAKEIIPEQWWPQTYVAGSAATRFGQHGDVDVWVTAIPRNINPLTIIPENQGKECHWIEGVEEEYEHIAIKIYNNPDEKLQIMACHDDIHTLLASFDISVHCGAMQLVTGEQIQGPGYSEKVTICNYIPEKPVLTLTRYLSIAKRYKDFRGMHDEKVQQCAAHSFYLKTPAMMEQAIRDNYVDVGL